MPDIASFPILPAPGPSAGAAAAATTPPASSGISGCDHSRLPQEHGQESFANILKRQADQAPASRAATHDDAPALPPGAAQIADLAVNLAPGGIPALVAQLVAGLAGQQSTAESAVSGVDTPRFAAPDASTMLPVAMDATEMTRPKGLADKDIPLKAALVTHSAEAEREARSKGAIDRQDDRAAQSEARDATPLAGTFLTLGTAKGADNGAASVTEMPATQDGDTPSPAAHEPNDSSLAALLAFFPPPNPAASTKASATPIAATDATPPRDSESGALPTLLTETPARNPGGDTEALRASFNESAVNARDKPAEFAAAQATSAEAGAQSKDPTGASRETSFENALAAAHAQIINHGHDRDIRTPANASNPIKVETPVGARGWDQEVGDKLVWMVGRQEQRAELVLNPPQLGRVEVSISLNGDQTSATFVAASPAVREALESALPRLREMFADAGLNLGQAQVGADSGSNAAGHGYANRENRENSSRFSGAPDGTSEGNMLRLTSTNQWTRQGRGLVDVFA